MTPEQFKLFLTSNEEATERAIEKHVNGDVRAIGKRLDDHATLDLAYQAKIDGDVTWGVKLILGAVVIGIVATLFK